MRRTRQGAHLDGRVHKPAQGGDEGGLPHRAIAHVGDHDDVGLGYLGMLQHVLRQRAAALLLTLDKRDRLHRHVTEHTLQRADRAQMHRDTALVVRGATAVEATVAHGGLEGR